MIFVVHLKLPNDKAEAIISPFFHHYLQNHKAAGLKSEPNIPNGQSLDEAIEELELAIR